MVPSLCGFLPFHKFKIQPPPSPSLPPRNLYTLPSPINMTTMIRQNTSFPPTVRPPGKLDHQAVHRLTADLIQLSTGSITNTILITVFHTCLTPTPRSPGAWACSALTHFSMSLACKYVNLKKPYTQDIKK